MGRRIVVAALVLGFWGGAWTLGGSPIESGTKIPVEQISGPVFLVAGGEDTLWDSYRSVPAIVDRMHAHGKDDVTALSYADAGHAVGFAVPNVPVPTVTPTRYGTAFLGGTPTADERGRADLWPKLLRFLANV